MALNLVAGAATYPLTLVEAKLHLRVDHDDEDVLIDLLLKAATGNAERFLGRALIEQTWDLFLSGFPSSGGIDIPLLPVIAVIGVFYRDLNGIEQEFAAARYSLNNTGSAATVELTVSSSWPTTSTASNAVRVQFRAGYLDSSSPPVPAVPFDIKAAILLAIGSLYAHKETVVVGQTTTQLPWGAEQLLRPHRVALGMA